MPFLNIQKVSVVIPTFNRRDMLQKILTQIYSQDITGIHLFVVVVVDGSTDGTLEMLESMFPQVYVVRGTGNWWYTKSMNKGFEVVRMLRSDYILTLNDDCEIPANYLRTMMMDATECPEDSILGSMSFTLSKPHRLTFSGSFAFRQWRFKYINYHKTLSVIDPATLSGIHPSLVLPGRGMLFPLSLLNPLKGFDEKFVQYASDYDFCFRARKKGAKVFITWNTCVFENTETTGLGTPWLQESWGDFLKGFLSPVSKNYIVKYIRFIARHGILLLLPVSLIFIFVAHFKNRFTQRLH